ncbi:MAG: efflux RND transporter periplasmic adaptor subunit [Chitinophagaceae bacterium]|nr:efflux RND transporter periplasmic adaptor subunit [Chitinophagaceae bacterium]
MRLFICIMMTGFILSCSSKQSEPAASPVEPVNSITLTDAQLKNAGVETGKVERLLLNSELVVNGMVDVPPQNIVSVSFPLGGYLRTTRLLPGMHVNKGEVIAVMEDQALVQLQQDYLIAQARLQYLSKDFERQKMLNENNVNADKVYQQAEADYKSQKVLVRGYSEKLRLLHINPDRLNEQNISRSVPVYSPINGFVSKVNVNIGKYVNPSDVLFELINPDDMHAALTVFEKDIAKVKPKQQVLVTFVDEPGTDYACEVLLVTKNVDENRSALVHCHFEKQPERLLPGMFLNARIRVSNVATLAVPEEAVLRYGNTQYLLEQTATKTFSLVEVQTGIRDGKLVEVISKTVNLEGMVIITRNPYPVLSAMKNTAEEE